MLAQVSFFFHNPRVCQTDRQTEGQTDRKALEILCVALHAVAR